MLMSYLYCAALLAAILAALITGRGTALSAAILTGAQSGVSVAFSMAGSICLWSGVHRLMERIGVTQLLAKFLCPLLFRLFPEAKRDAALAGDLSGNICANFLGLGNAATPMGIRSARRLASYQPDGNASNSLCRLIVLNTASIQLIPSNVAALRLSYGSSTPFDILPAVWLASLCSASLGLAAAFLFGKWWKHD